jgi:glycosyltransferase involved in cell wall biosynthesis
MKVTSLTWKFNTGGAGIAAHRLNAALLHNLSYEVFELDKTVLLKNIINPINLIIYVFCQINSIISVILKIIYQKQISFLLLPTFIFLKKKVINADVLHVHLMTGGFFSLFDLLILSKFKKIVWINHDKFILNCWDHAGGEGNFNLQCHIINLVLKNPNVVVVALSDVYKNEISVKKSSWLESSRLHLIPNPIGMATFKRANRSSRDRLTIGFVALDLDDDNKGFDDFLLISNGLNSVQKNFVFHVCGRTKRDLVLQDNIVMFGELQSHLMFDFYKGLDILLVLSKIENSPNVILEAVLNDVFVFSYDVGGISELVDSNFLLRYNDISGMVDILKGFDQHYDDYFDAHVEDKLKIIEYRSPKVVSEKYGSLFS